MERDLTSGSVFKNIVWFSLPFLFSYFLQLLYGLADLYIVGQFNGTEVTTAVSIGSQITHMITIMIVGLSMGATVLIGRAVGSHDQKLKNQAIGNGVTLFLGLSLVVTMVMMFLIHQVIGLMATPEAAVSGTASYLRICFLGIPFITAYNLISALFRGMGDSQSPMYVVFCACVLNIGLDYLFIGTFGMGAAGAAIATTLAQGISVLLALIVIIKKQMIKGITLKDFHLQRSIYSKIIFVGGPIAAQEGFIQVAFLLITIFANRRGLNDAAAVGIVEKLITFLFLVPSSMMNAVAALCAQNIGAGKMDRARESLRDSVWIVVVYGALVAVVFQFAAAWAVGQFTQSEAVVLLGEQYLRSYSVDTMLAGVHFVFSGYFNACNRSGVTFAHNIISVLTTRIPLSYYCSIHFTSLFPMGMAAPIGSFVSILICVGVYRRIRQ